MYICIYGIYVYMVYEIPKMDVSLGGLLFFLKTERERERERERSNSFLKEREREREREKMFSCGCCGRMGKDDSNKIKRSLEDKMDKRFGDSFEGKVCKILFILRRCRSLPFLYSYTHIHTQTIRLIYSTHFTSTYRILRKDRTTQRNIVMIF
jgi:hypothetical protein